MRDDRRPRIVICRLSHIGDCILTVPVLNALRSRFPRAEITWVVEPPADQLLEGHGALDHLVVVPRGWMKSPNRVRRLQDRLRARHINVAVDPQSLTKSAAVAWLSGAGRRIGLARPGGRELAPLLNNCLVQPKQPHVVDRSLQLLEPLGVHGPQVAFRLPERPQARQVAEQFIRRAHLGCGFALINPGAGWPSRLWSPRRFGAVARFLGQRHALPSVVSWAGQQERCWAESIVARSGGHALLAPRTNLSELGALLRRATLFVGCDTGPMHLAVAVGTRCVVLHGPTRPELSGPYGSQHVTVQAYYQPGTRRQRRHAGNEAMMAIQVDAVCAACDAILSRRGSEQTSEQAA